MGEAVVLLGETPSYRVRCERFLTSHPSLVMFGGISSASQVPQPEDEKNN